MCDKTLLNRSSEALHQMINRCKNTSIMGCGSGGSLTDHMLNDSV